MTYEAQALISSNKARSTFAWAAMASAFASLATFVIDSADARGGFRGGGGISMSRGGFGGLSRGSLSRPQGMQRPSGAASQRSAGQGAQQAQAGARGAGRDAATSRPANGTSASRGNTGINGGNATGINRGNGNTGINGGNTTGINRGNGNGNGSGNTGINGNNVNNVNNGNVVAGNNVDVDVNNGGWNWGEYPAGAAYATGVAVGTTATAAAIGTYYSTLPATCSPYVWNSINYYTCAGAWYRPEYRGTSVVYVSVANPTK
jgi:hypothetical protein